MAAPVSYSSTPLVFDALPALKVRYYTASIPFKIYTYARMYVQAGALALSFYCFEKQPQPGSGVSFGVTQPGKSLLFLSLFPENVTLAQYPLGTLLPTTTGGTPLPAPAPAYFAGQDEQGWYWGASVLLPRALLGQCGLTLAPGAVFNAAVFYQPQGSAGYGASCPLGPGGPLNPGQFDVFEVVDY